MFTEKYSMEIMTMQQIFAVTNRRRRRQTLFVDPKCIFCTFSFVLSKFINSDYEISQDRQKMEIPGLIRKTLSRLLMRRF